MTETQDHSFDQVTHQTDEEFYESAKPALEQLESIRKKKLITYNFRKKMALIGSIILVPALIYIDYLLISSSNDGDGAGVTILALGAVYAWVTQPKRQYARSYKKEILPKISQLFGNFLYHVDGKIEISAMKLSKILPNHDKYKSEDYFKGQYKGVDLEFSEITLKKRRRSGKRTYYEDVFKGLALLLTAEHKRFYGHTILDRNKSVISQWFTERFSNLEKVDLVDPDFEKIFDVYSNDQVEARYLIDPLMIEKLNGLYQEYNGNKMAAAFFDNKMLILIANNHNHFEPADLHVPATNSHSIISMKHEIAQTLAVIDKLSLYNPDDIHKNVT